MADDDAVDKLIVSDLEHRARVTKSWGDADARAAVARRALRWAVPELEPDEVLALVQEILDAAAAAE